MEGAPDWQDGECCFRCRTQFTLVARKHHCRNCGNIFCAKCSSQQIPLPKLNIEKNVRVCDGCYEAIADKNDDPTSSSTSGSTDNKATTDSHDKNVKSSKSNPSGSFKTTSSTSNKQTANASAPSEQELREEEELQLAMALSLSETPAKISFPDCRQFEDNAASTSVTSAKIDISNKTNSHHINDRPSSIPNSQPSPITTNINTAATMINTPTASFNMNEQYVSSPEKHQQQPTQYPQENQWQESDRELFNFVAEVQSTCEVFTNRVNSNKLRNRPIANDSAIQTLFMKLTNMHSQILEHIKTHDEERAKFECLQDKLSQISDARAALDALREEHMEKVRQEAAEAERQRQSQLALKLEMMRQKKTQMMQYQREIALQRIQAQEMMMQQSAQGFSTSIVNRQALPDQQQALTVPQHQQQSNIQQSQHSDVTLAQSRQQSQPDIHQQGPSTSVIHQPSVHQQSDRQQLLSHQLNILQQPQSFRQHNGQQYLPQDSNQTTQPPQQPSPPIPKVEDDAPLISFDD